MYFIDDGISIVSIALVLVRFLKALSPIFVKIFDKLIFESALRLEKHSLGIFVIVVSLKSIVLNFVSLFKGEIFLKFPEIVILVTFVIGKFSNSDISKFSSVLVCDISRVCEIEL